MAEGAGGKEVGRISIRVVPNTDRFRADLQRQLDEIEKDTKAKIRIDPDLDGFREKVDAATRGLKDAKVKVKTEFDNSDAVKQFEQRMESFNSRVKLKTSLDKSSLEKTIGEAKLAAAAADVKIRVRTERRGGLQGLMGGVESGARNLFSGLKFPDIVPNIGGTGAATSIAIIVAVASLLAPALALVAQALVGLPALIAGVALPLGVFALGLGGIKKALDDSGILDDVKGKGKNAKDKQSLGSVLKGIQQQVSDVFEKGFTPLFREVAGVLPTLLRGLPFVAQGIVNLATGLTSALTSGQNVANFDRFTNSVASMLTRLSPGLVSFTNAMSNLVTNVGDHLPGLATTMSSWGDQFSAWVTKISKPKQDWFERDIPNSSVLDSAVSNLKPVLNSIINFVGELTKAGLQLAANPQMADNIKKVVDGLTNMITSLLPQLNTVFDKLAAIMGKIQGPEQKDPKLQPSKTGAQFAGTPVGQQPEDRNKNQQADNSPHADPKTGFDLIQQWFEKTFTRPHTDHPVIVQGGVGQPQQPQPQPVQTAQQPKVDLNSVAQSIQASTGQIAAAANAAFQGLVAAATVAVSQAVQAVQQLPGAIAQALAGVGAAATAAGQSIGTGMAAGIAASAPSAIAAAQALASGVEAASKGALKINSPSKVFEDIGQGVGEGFTNGLDGGAPGVIDAAHRLAQQVTDAVASHNIGGNLQGEIKNQLGAITVEQDRLRAQKDGTTDKGQKKALQGQIDQLNVSKDQLKASASQLGYSQKYGDSQEGNVKQQEAALDVQRDQIKAQLDQTTDKGKRRDLQQQLDNIKAQKDQLKLQDQGNGKTKKADDLNQQLGQSLNKMVDIGKNFAMANVNQFETDIGIGGQGAIPTIANIGLNWATGMLGNMITSAVGGQGGTHIHVNNVDDAVEAHTRVQNQKAQQYVGR